MDVFCYAFSTWRVSTHEHPMLSDIDVGYSGVRLIVSCSPLIARMSLAAGASTPVTALKAQAEFM